LNEGDVVDAWNWFLLLKEVWYIKIEIVLSHLSSTLSCFSDMKQIVFFISTRLMADDTYQVTSQH